VGADAPLARAAGGVGGAARRCRGRAGAAATPWLSLIKSRKVVRL